MARQMFETKRPRTSMTLSEAWAVRRPLAPEDARVLFTDNGTPFVRGKYGELKMNYATGQLERGEPKAYPLGRGCHHMAYDWSGNCHIPECDANIAAQTRHYKAQAKARVVPSKATEPVLTGESV